MKDVSLRSSSHAEWIKFRSVPSALYGLITMVILTVGLGAVINLVIGNHYHSMQPGARLTFDPYGDSLVGVFFAQFVVGVVGTMFMTNEYAASSIRTSLAAVPRRILLVASKLLVMTTTFIVACEAIMFATFLLNQAILHATGAPSFPLGAPGVVHGIILGGLYLVLLAALGFSLGLMFRKTNSAIVIFVVILLVLPILVAFLPSDWSGPISRYLPSDLGVGMLSRNQALGTYPPYGCALLLFGYVSILLGAATYLFTKRDA